MSRDLVLDNVKGLLIFLVVLSHFILPYVVEGYTGPAIYGLFYFIYCFHMPFFVFISGYFSKNVQKGRDTAFMRFLVPFLFFNTTMMLILNLAGKLHFTLLTPVYVNWYLLALFVWRFMLKDIIKVRFVLPLSVLAALLVGFSQEVTNYLSLGRIIAFLPFFLLGYFTTSELLAKIRRVNIVVPLVGLALAGMLFYRLIQQGGLSLSLVLAEPYGPGDGIDQRATFFILAVLISVCVFMLAPGKRIPLLTNWGQNTLLIYLLHRYVNFAFYEFVPLQQWRDWYFVPVVVLSVMTASVLGLPIWMRLYQNATQWISQQFIQRTDGTRQPIHTLACFLAIIVVGLLVAGRQRQFDDDPIYPIISPQLVQKLDRESVTISFVGDLILLEDQVKQALNPDGTEYDFGPVFEYTKDRLRAADYAVGVLEVPLAGSQAGYSTSNFGDGIPLYLNAPDAWATAIRNAGIDLVTTANNHIVDKGVDGAQRTLDTLDRIGLAHVGSSRPEADGRSKRIFITDVKGVRLAFLAYTYGANDADDVELDEIVNVLASPNAPTDFEKCRRRLVEDIEQARLHDPDLIIALPHMGTQFIHESDAFSRKWANTMIAEGVDAVLACHAHAVQPMEFLSVTGSDGTQRKGFVVYCPGNFVNCYTERDGDAAAIVNLHVTKSRGATRIDAASIVPLWIQRFGDGQFCPLPVTDALQQPKLRSILSELDTERIRQVHEIVTEAMLGVRLTVDQLQDRYYFLPATGYMRQLIKASSTDVAQFSSIENDTTRAEFHRALREARKVVLAGDSISEGTKNGGYSWIEPSMAYFPDTRVINESRGGRTTGKFIKELADLPEHDADMIILALGVNDVRYRDERTCAMTPEAYISNIEKIVAQLRQKNPRASFAAISLWPAFDNDRHCRLSDETRDSMIDTYNAYLKRYCRQHGHLFIDATTPIRDFLRHRVTDNYLLDHIHPDANLGVRLYCDAVLFGSAGLARE